MTKQVSKKPVTSIPVAKELVFDEREAKRVKGMAVYETPKGHIVVFLRKDEFGRKAGSTKVNAKGEKTKPLPFTEGAGGVTFTRFGLSGVTVGTSAEGGRLELVCQLKHRKPFVAQQDEDGDDVVERTVEVE